LYATFSVIIIQIITLNFPAVALTAVALPFLYASSKPEEWIEARMRELFPCPDFHIVFTMPHELNSLCMGDRNYFFDLLFKAASYKITKVDKRRIQKKYVSYI
jgi:hypothetical protein